MNFLKKTVDNQERVRGKEGEEAVRFSHHNNGVMEKEQQRHPHSPCLKWNVTLGVSGLIRMSEKASKNKNRHSSFKNKTDDGKCDIIPDH